MPKERSGVSSVAVNGTETTPAPAAAGRQVGQVLAGRYRLGLFKGGDDIADVWHALDDTTQSVVTLEILRDRSADASRQRFLAEARLMAAIERPSVMRVAAIHDDATDTFIVFEHLIPLPVVLTGLTAVAKDAKPATKAAEESAARAADDRTTVLSAVAGPTRAAAPHVAIDEAAQSTIVAPDAAEPPIAPPTATVRMPETLQSVSTSLTSARAELSGAVDEAKRLAADTRLLLREMRPDSFIASARARLPKQFDMSALTTPVMRVVAEVRELTGVASRTGAASPARGASTTAAEGVGRTAAMGRTALSSLAAMGMSAASAAAPLIGRARGNRFVLGAGALIVLAIVVVASPLDDAIARALRGAPAASPTAAPRAALVPAPFEVPPLAAYGAAFESQGPYPTTTPNGMVEWVVALRNTGAAGWYRGLEGAQAALALPDGTGVAVQSTDYVAPGQVGWFVVHFRAGADVGTYTVPLVPRIDGRGPLQDLGIYAVVTVAKNP